jgi:hypothetical protein
MARRVTVTVIFPIVALFALCYALFVGIRSASRTRRFGRDAGAALWCLALAILSFPVAARLREMRLSRCAAIARRGDEVVSALERYRELHGAYPQNLKEACSRPCGETGLAAYPHFQYRSPASAQPEVPYEILLPMPYGANGDVLLYWPTTDYPDNLYSGGVVPVGSWAYIWE